MLAVMRSHAKQDVDQPRPIMDAALQIVGQWPLPALAGAAG